MLVVVTYKQYHWNQDKYIEKTVTFPTKWAFQEELEKCEQKGTPMIVTGMWCW